MKKAKRNTLARALGLGCSLGLAIACVPAHATEGSGLPSYPDGLENFGSGALPPPGIYGMVYTGYAQYDKIRGDHGQDIGPPDFRVKVGVLAPRVVWVTQQSILGGQLAFHALAPLLDVDARVAGRSFHSRGLGDITVGPALAYHASPALHYALGLDITMPSGQYSLTNPSSLGKNIWVYQPLVALSYIQPEGVNADIKLMYDFNGRNGATQTRSGQAIHADYALGWGFGNGLVAGVGGYLYQQVTNDSGANAAAGKSQALAIGPNLKYDNGKGFIITAKFQQEYDARNRPEGKQFYVKAILPF
ncbi:enzyme involved in meta-pathway of phenol degradation protein [Herbaspirillum rubrisubalbicans M1]|uniref:SphA family protein n=1 Tax=Herbaspirillum rubrisubalbicans TaxID=80842 RepID=UPI00073A418E|nr:transporter [Herbaspirillum rubrisubalbicans]ALU91582.1 enzyme involved in meta-pathway of phenol degradation protein [Herbaspirillum rubrisubalbicans M1]